LRIDRFLKMTHIVKRRSTAREMISLGAVRVGEMAVRPSRLLKPGDTVEIAFPRKILTIKVVSIEEAVVRRRTEAFELVGERNVTGDERPW